MHKIKQFPVGTVRQYVSTRNACKLCSPLGASIVYRGIEGCIPLIHGSQGCATYIRRYVISHFREPMDIASSNFNESAAVFGGADNFKTALKNVIRQYNPEVIGVASTCLSETIGDDIGRYLSEYRIEKTDASPVIIHASTPSYSGTHMEGFRAALLSTVKTLAEQSTRHEKNRLNIISSFLSAEDLRYMKEILDDSEIRYVLLPDYSETLDGETWEDYQKTPQGGTPVELIRGMGNGAGTIELGAGITANQSVAGYLQNTFGVPGMTMNIPVGIDLSDKFISAIENYSGKTVGERFKKERGRLVDAYIDAHKYLFGLRAILYGEADLISGLASFMSEIGVKVVLCATGARKGDLPPAIADNLAKEGVIMSDDTDFVTMLEKASELSPNIVIGSSKGLFLSKNLNIPIVRCGFPIHDRFGGQRVMHIGYRGTQQLLDRIVNAVLEARQNDSPVGYSYM